jgi:hypothetical protein
VAVTLVPDCVDDTLSEQAHLVAHFSTETMAQVNLCNGHDTEEPVFSIAACRNRLILLLILLHVSVIQPSSGRNYNHLSVLQEHTNITQQPC